MKYSCSVFLIFIFHFIKAQNALTIQQIEGLFLKNNLVLLAEQLNISASKAAVMQARIWDLPYVTAEFNAINPDANRYFDVGKEGQKAIAIQQLIYLGGKKKNEIELAKSSVQAAELQLEDLLRNLRYELKESYYTVYFKQSEIQITDRQIANLDTLINTYRVQANKGNIPMKDLVRLQSLYFDLKNQRTNLFGTLIEEKERLKLITGSGLDFVATIESFDNVYAGKKPDNLSIDSLLAKALENRPDYLLADRNIITSEWNVKLQKSRAIPDLTLGVSYDQRGGAFTNQGNVVVGIPLPLWNRNKGNIKIAESQYRQSGIYKNYLAGQVQAEVAATYQKWIIAYSNYQNLLNANSNAFEEVYNGVVNNFRKKNITIIEFSDFMESFNQSMMHFNEIKRNLVITSEELNKSVHYKAIN